MPQNPEDLDNFLILKQQNIHLKKKNEELEQQIAEIKQATEELAKLRKESAIESIAGEVRKKVLGGIGLLGIASIAGLWGLYNTANNLIITELSKSERLNQISDIVTTKVSADLSKKFSGDSVFRNTIIDVLATKLPANQEFMGKLIDNLLQSKDLIDRMVAIAANQKDQGLKEVATLASKSSNNLELNQSINANLSKKRYYVIAASSTQRKDLEDLIGSAQANNLKPYICSPRGASSRYVLILTNPKPEGNSDSLTFQFVEAKNAEKKAKTIDKTAYILEASASNENTIWFDRNKCESP